MTTPHNTNRRTVLKTLGAAALGGTVLSGSATAQGGRGSSPLPPDLTVTGTHDHENEEHIFELNNDTLNAGWNTVYFDNQTSHTHFAYLAELPQDAVDDAEDEDIGDGMDPLEFYYETITKPFQYFMDLFVPDKTPDSDDLSSLYTLYDPGDLIFSGLFPYWFPSVQPSGGTGLTAGGKTSKTTVNLDPDQSGVYIVECYVKNSDNVFHGYLGMLDSFDVASDGSSNIDPNPTAKLEISSSGLSFPTEIRNGPHTFEVTFEDQTAYSHLLGHDAHLIRLDGSSASDIQGWMNWINPSQLISDGTEPGPFLGGVQNIRTPALLEGTGSETAYVQVNLPPGEYAWVAEVPFADDVGDPINQSMYEEFTVSKGGRGGGGPP